MFFSFPSSDSGWVNSEKSCQFPAGQAEAFPVGPEPCNHRFGLTPIVGVIPQKNSDPGSEAESRSNPICLPVLNRAFRDANPLRRFSLQQAEIESTLSEMIPDGLEF